MLTPHHLELVKKAKKNCELAAIMLGKLQNSPEQPWKLLSESYEHIQTAALRLQQIPEPPRTESSPLAPVVVADQTTKATASLTANGLRIVVNEPLPTRIKSRARYSLERQRWLAMIVPAIKQADKVEAYEKAFVLIKVFFPNRKPKDLDNLEIKFVLDAIRYAQLVPDDSWDHLTYLPLGFCDPTSPRTELLVTNWDKVESSLHSLTQP